MSQSQSKFSSSEIGATESSEDSQMLTMKTADAVSTDAADTVADAKTTTITTTTTTRNVKKRTCPLEMSSTSSFDEYVSVKKFKTSPHHPLIFATNYELNNSYSKKVVIGLSIEDDGDFKPVVRFLDNKTRGISINLQEWLALQQKFDIISDYFEGRCIKGGVDGKFPPSPIRIGRYQIIFTTSYNAKSVLIGMLLENEKSSTNNSKQEKKEVLCTSNIVMQLPTFEGLYNLVGCIDERMRNLERISSEVKLCKDLFVSELCDYFDAEKIMKPSTEFVRQLLKVKFEFFKQQIKSKLSPEFVSQYFEIVFCEVTSILNSYVSFEVKEKMCKRLKKTIKP